MIKIKHEEEDMVERAFQVIKNEAPYRLLARQGECIFYEIDFASAKAAQAWLNHFYQWWMKPRGFEEWWLQSRLSYPNEHKCTFPIPASEEFCTVDLQQIRPLPLSARQWHRTLSRWGEKTVQMKPALKRRL